MRLFDHKILLPLHSTLHGELFQNERFNLPLTLFWKINISLKGFTLGNYPIVDPVIELGSFTLPHTSFVPDGFSPLEPVLTTWRQLPFSKFDFRLSHVDNIGILFYYINHKHIYDNLYDGEAMEFFDNIIDIEEITFGEIVGNCIATKVKMKIDFDGFNMHDPPFRKDWYSNTFEMNLNIEIKDVLLNLGGISNVTTLEQVQTLCEKSLNISDYKLKSAPMIAFKSLTESYEYTEFKFEPLL